MLLDGAVAVVTGAGTGIGREISLRLAADGADVVLTGRSTEAMEEVAELVRSAGRRALPVAMDLRDPASIEAAARAAEAEFGRVDVLVNNSGVGGPSKPMWEIDLEEWEDTFRVNVTGTFLACKAFLPGMVARRSGSVVVVGSVTGKRPLVNRTPYAASKTALIGMVRTLAWEVGAYGIRVNLVSPGGVEGERINWVLEQQAAATGHHRRAGAGRLRRGVAAEATGRRPRRRRHRGVPGLLTGGRHHRRRHQRLRRARHVLSRPSSAAAGAANTRGAPMTTSDRIGWGIVGLGRIAETEIAPAVTAAPNSTLAGVVSRTAAKARGVRRTARRRVRLRRLPGAARRPLGRRRLHRDPERPARRPGGGGGRSRQARALRQAAGDDGRRRRTRRRRLRRRGRPPRHHLPDPQPRGHARDPGPPGRGRHRVRAAGPGRARTRAEAAAELAHATPASPAWG